jgi:hypothetical protein
VSTCNITGSLISLSGAPLVGACVFVRRDDPGNTPPFVAGGAGVGVQEISTVTDAQGQFSVTLAQGAPVVIRIPDLALHFQAVVPMAASATLKELVDAHL